MAPELSRSARMRCFTAASYIRRVARTLPRVLADVFEHLAAFNPLRRRLLRNRPLAGPRLCIDAGVVDGEFVGQRPQVRTGDALDHVELVGGRIRARDPLLLVEPDGVDDERVPAPAADRVAEIGGPEAGRMRAAVHVDHAPRVRARDVDDVDLLLFRALDDLESRSGEESVARGRLAADERRIQIVLRRSELLERPRPRLRGDVVAARHAAETRTDLPVAFVLFRRPEIHMAVRPARRRLRRLRERGCRENHDREPREPGEPREPRHRMTSFCPVDSTIIVVGIEPAELLPSLASAAPSTVTLSPIFSVSFFQPPRTSAYGGPISTR